MRDSTLQEPLPARSRPAARPPEALLEELEERHARLCEELSGVERRLRELRTAAELCPLCGGSGERWVRGGLYGETQRRPCSCTEADQS